jgi:predicted DNA-binding protein YlxM (UPF0122 family)
MSKKNTKRSRYVAKAQLEVKRAKTAREVYLAEYRGGKTVSEIATEHGVSRQAVSQAINGREKFMERQRARDRVRRAPTLRKGKICSICKALGLGEKARGHQKNSPEHHPENAAA